MYEKKYTVHVLHKKIKEQLKQCYLIKVRVIILQLFIQIMSLYNFIHITRDFLNYNEINMQKKRVLSM